MSDLSPTTENRTLPRRQVNGAYRQREYLTETEVEKLIETARRRGRNPARDSAAILVAYRHGLRAQELCSMRWSQLDLRSGRLHVNRAKGGTLHLLHPSKEKSNTAKPNGQRMVCAGRIIPPRFRLRPQKLFWCRRDRVC